MIENRLLNITDVDVAECEDKVTLLSWKDSIALQKLGIRQKLNKDYKGKITCDKARKLDYAYNIQSILSQMIQTRLTELKEVQKERFLELFISKCKNVYPDVFEDLKGFILDEFNN
jgi:hypothetical protein